MYVNYGNGSFYLSAIYIDDAASDGILNYYYPNGVLSSEVEILNVKFVTLCNVWDMKGSYIGKRNLKRDNNRYFLNDEGEMDGPFIDYYSDDKFKTTGFYKNGQKHDTWEYWYKNGNLKSQEHYGHGVEIGIWKTWDEDGTLNSEIHY